MKLSAYLFFLIFLISCSETKTIDTDIVKKEIADSEKAFETMAKETGIAEAFAYYADSSAVIKRQNDTLIKGKEAIRNYYSADYYKTAAVSWAPDFIDVSNEGDLAYTYGKYLWQSKDSVGNVQEFKGVFHTVWKKQKDGSWKYVWD